MVKINCAVPSHTDNVDIRKGVANEVSRSSSTTHVLGLSQLQIVCVHIRDRSTALLNAYVSRLSYTQHNRKGIENEISEFSICTNMTIKKIKSLRPEFKFGGITMVDWFEVINSDSFCIIRSGLRHADGVTKSPFYYEEVTIGKKSAKDAVNKFTKWWNEIKK